MNRVSILLIPGLLMLLLAACDDATGFQQAEETEAEFAAIQANVFDNSCAVSGCHNGTTSPNLSSGQAYNNIVNITSSRGIPYVDPGDPNNSYLYRKIIGSNISGSRMPLGEGALSSSIADSIEAWIDRGALNN